MAQPINHDGLSSATTAGGEVLKWGALGAIAAFAIPALIVAIPLSLIGLGTLGLIGGAVAGVFGFMAGGAAMGVGGGLLGAVKGNRRVNDEEQAFRDRVRGNMESQKHKHARIYNNGEIAGVQEGYGIGRADGEQVGFQKGQEFVVRQLQQHVQQHLAAQQQMAMAAQAPQSDSKFSDEVASCKCESKVEMVDKQREAAAVTAVAGAQVG